jgi:hypothetical protein
MTQDNKRPELIIPASSRTRSTQIGVLAHGAGSLEKVDFTMWLLGKRVWTRWLENIFLSTSYCSK